MRATPDELAFIRAHYASPVGTIVLLADAQGRLRVLDFDDYEERMRLLLHRQYGGACVAITDGPLPAMAQALDAYFSGAIEAIDALATETGGTPFQRSVWRALRDIPAGATMSYGALAQKLGMPKAVRAVGLANGANPIGIVVPCHRVIGANGSLTGYGGGLPRKQWLLEHERRHRRASGTQLPLALDGGRA